MGIVTLPFFVAALEYAEPTACLLDARTLAPTRSYVVLISSFLGICRLSYFGFFEVSLAISLSIATYRCHVSSAHTMIFMTLPAGYGSEARKVEICLKVQRMIGDLQLPAAGTLFLPALLRYLFVRIQDNNSRRGQSPTKRRVTLA